MAAHPQCPCTRASMEGLAHVVAGANKRLAVYVLMTKPSGTAEGWERSDTWDAAERISGVRVLTDRDGAEAHLFGARTSGQTLLYDPGGKLVFRGGLTSSRGHAGPSLGQNSILALVHGGTVDTPLTEVFGCALTSAVHKN